ncbi:MAG: carboxymuconolactone decarboxylase family protein [Actinobacteria bacterium]|nr:carboxymuconolactone decarboxylase family protein [Actinomycetota bacterium]
MREALAALRPAVQRHPGPVRDNRPQAPNTMETFAHHPDLARAFFTFNGHVLFGTTLTARHRQILVLRVATRRKAAYVWAQHVFLARDAGLTDEEIARIAFGPQAPFVDTVERALLRAVDELIDDGAISDETWHMLEAKLGVRQLLDVIFTVGCYETTSWFFRSVEVEVDPGQTE